MKNNQIIEFQMNDLTQVQKEALTEFQFQMVKADNVPMWMACYLHTAEGIHDLTNKDIGSLMNFHLSVFISSLLKSPDCEEKNNYINEAISLLNTNRPKGVTQ